MLALLGLLPLALADSSGQTGRSTSGCSCHAASADATTTASFSTSSSTVAPGDSVSVSFIVSTTSGSRTAGGLDVSATGGTLAAGSNNQLSGGEITHTRAEAMSSGSVTFNFTWTAPASEGTYTLRGMGNAVNNNGRDTGDGWNSATSVSITVDDGCDDNDGDGYEVCDDGSGTDCDDGNANVYPGAAEYCGGTDHDCDGLTDEADSVDATEYFDDDDGDGYGDPFASSYSCTAVGGAVTDDTDCDDGDAYSFPGAPEYCDYGNDCDSGTTSRLDAETWYQDADGDGYGGMATTEACTLPSGYVADSTDCDDTAVLVNPGATETCNGRDDDCDGDADSDATDRATYYADVDGDGYGNAGDSALSCDTPAGYVSNASDCDDSSSLFNPGATEACDDPTDYNCDGSVAYDDADADGYPACMECDDGNANTNPGATESCNGVDDDCDGTVDNDSASDAATWYADADSDGYGDSGTTTIACDQPIGFVADDSDCDDSSANTFPGAPETCDGDDDDCDGTTDDDATDALPWYADADGDGYGDPLSTEASCDVPTGYVADNTDCDDGNAGANPSATETCNVADDDCDGTTDEASALDATAWYADSDGDGFGNILVSVTACSPPEGYVSDDQDCDDSRGDVFPGAEEVWYDGTDDDCDGNDADADLDGFDWPVDCNDEDPYVNPSQVDTFYDGVDTNCDGLSDYDADGDTFDSESYGGTDCDDADATSYPGAPEVPDDGVENDCDVRNDHDRDDDGYDDVAYGGEDCDDADSSVNPGADDEWYDGIDSDCDGSDDYDQDHDGIPVGDDCDDTNPRDDSAPCQEPDTGDPADTGAPPGLDRDPKADAQQACGCAGSFAAAPLLALVTLAARRRRTA